MCSLFNSRTTQTSSRKGELRTWTVQAKIGAGDIESQSSKQIRVRAGGRESQSSKQIRVRAGGRESQSSKQIRVRAGGRESQSSKQIRVRAGGRESQSSKQIRVRAGGRESRNSPGHNRINNPQWRNTRNDHFGKSRLRKDECVWCAYMERV